MQHEDAPASKRPMRLVGIARLARTGGTTARRSARRGPRPEAGRSRTTECGRRRRPPGRRGLQRPSASDARTPDHPPVLLDAAGRPRPACAGETSGSARACSARKSRKSHCGMKAMKRQRVGRWRKSAIVTAVAELRRELGDACRAAAQEARRAGRARAMTSSVEGWSVSPRKSRRKSACFSSTTTRRRRARAAARASCRRGRRRR